MRRLLVLLAALCVVAGCSTSIAGAPSPEAAPAGASPGATDLNLPPRPRELRIDGLDPCSSLTSAQLAKLDLKVSSPSLPTDPAGPSGKFCTASGFNGKIVSVAIAFVTNRGIEAAVNNPEAKAGDIQPSLIANFPGVLTRRPVGNSCVADIDVALKQLIDIEYTDLTTPTSLSTDQLCQAAAAVGEEVIRSLQGR
jgi:uncharacterized protein DUF3558